MSASRAGDPAAAVFWSAARQGPKAALRAALHLLTAPSPLVQPPAAVRALRGGVAGRLAKASVERLGAGAWNVALHRPETRRDERASRRVLLVSHELTASGAPKVVVEIAGAFRELGCEVLVVAPQDGPFRETLRALGATVLVDSAILGGGGVAAGLGRGFDLAICNTVVSDALLARISRHCPCVWYIHEVSLLEQKLDQVSFREALSRAREVWTGSEIPASLIRPLRGDVRIVPYGLEPAPRGDTAGAGTGRLKIGLFGSIEPRKGQDLALAALARLSPAAIDAIELTVFGRVLIAPFGDALFETMSKLPHVFYGGALDYETYLARLSEVDAVLIPSRDDTLPLVSLDALSSGRVLLTSNKVGTSSYLTDGEDGFLATDASAEALADMLERAIDQRAAWSRIGEAGRAVFAAGFSKTAFHARLEALLDEVAPVRAPAQARG